MNESEVYRLMGIDKDELIRLISLVGTIEYDNNHFNIQETFPLHDIQWTDYTENTLISTAELDEFNRPQGISAILVEKQCQIIAREINQKITNRGGSITDEELKSKVNRKIKNQKNGKPAFWKDDCDFEEYFERGHVLGKSLGGNELLKYTKQKFRKLLFPQTKFSNKNFNGRNDSNQYSFEEQIREKLHDGKKVYYSSKLIYKDKFDKISIGIWIKAYSDDSSINLNIFIPNVDPEILIDYRNGTITNIQGELT